MILRLPQDLLVVFIILILSNGLGLKILCKIFKLTFNSKLQEFLFSIGFGLFLFSYFTFIFGFLKLLYSYIFIVVGFIVFLFCFREIKSILYNLKSFFINFIKFRPETKFNIFLFLILLISLICNFLFCYAPPLQIREMWYDLAIPRRYVMEHQIFNMYNNFTSHYPLQIQMLYTLIMNFGDGITAKLFNYFLGILNIILIFSITREFINKDVALLASTIFGLMPITISHFGVGNIEFGYLFYGLLSVYTILCYRNLNNSDNKTLNQWFYLAAFTSGCVISCKIPGISVVITVFLFIVYFEIFKNKINILNFIKKFFIYSLIICFVYSPWLIKNLVFAANPFYPLSIFGLPVHENVILESKIIPHILNQKYDFLWRLNQHHNLLFGLLIHGPGPIVFSFIIPWLLLKKDTANINIILLFAFINFFVLYFLIPPPKSWLFELRYFYVSYALFALISSYAVIEIRERFNLKKTVNFLVIFGLIFPCFCLSAYFGFKRIPIFIGFQSEKEYILNSSDFFKGYDLIEFVNKNLKKYDKILSIGIPCENDYYFIPQIIYSDLNFRNLTNIKNVYLELKKNNIKYILFHRNNFYKLKNHTYIQKSSDKNFISSLVVKWDIEKYSNKYFELVYISNDGIYLWKVK